MGIAAYNRGSAALSRALDAETRPVEFEIMDRLNALAKYSDAPAPFGPIQFVNHRGYWIAECPVTGYGFFPYHSLDEAVRSWRVLVTGFKGGVWLAEVSAQ